jgi:hypothetical protein
MLLRALLVVGLISGLTLVAPGEAQAAKGKGKREHAIHGVIESIQFDKDKDHGTMVLKVHHHKKKKSAAGSAATEKTVVFGKHTKVEIGKGGKERAGSISDLRKGEHVAVLEKGKQAEKIVIHEGKKGKKKKKQI